MAIRLHCIVKKHESYWSARCLDFSLYAVGSSEDEAKRKLSDEIDEYLYDAIEGEDKEHAAFLLLRKAEAREWILFYALVFLARCKSLKRWIGESFSPALPNHPFHHRSA